MLKRLKEIRSELKKVPNNEEMQVLTLEILELVQSDEFGNFMSLSTIYKQQRL